MNVRRWVGERNIFFKFLAAFHRTKWQDFLKTLRFFEFVDFICTSEVSETFSTQHGWHVLGTEQRHRTETKPLWEGRHTPIACGFSIQLLSDGPACSTLVPLPEQDCHTAGSTYCTCGKVCDSLVGTVCFSPVLVMFLLGCGKNISRGWRDNGNMWLVKDWPQPIIS